MEEFVRLPHTLGPELAHKQQPHCRDALKNGTKNRYENVLPYDRNRYRHPSKDDFYINASHVKLHEEAPEYLVAQGPLPHTRSDFWEMVKESGSAVVVNVTPFVERNFPKCAEYYPPRSGDSVKYNDITVETVKVTKLCEAGKEGIVLRELEIHHDGEGSHLVTHLQYENWPDMAVPHIGVLAHLVDAMHSLQRSAMEKSECELPITVHCSAGIGRSGVTVALHHVLERHHRRQRSHDLRELVRKMREPHEGRVGMIQTPDQFQIVKRLTRALEENPSARSMADALEALSN